MKKITLTADDAGMRLDACLARHAAEHSRARWQALIKEGHVKVDGKRQKPNFHLSGTETIQAEEPSPETVELLPENIPLDVIHEDDDIVVVNKPPGLVVHPAPGHHSGTLVNALLFHCRDPVTGKSTLAGIGGERRPGIVHRLDKDTSGVLVVAKTEAAMRSLVEQFKNRTVEKKYLALVWGCPQPPAGRVETLVGRSVHNRKKMTANPKSGRHAITVYQTEKAFKDISLLRVRIETGRTHQIRVHMSHIGHPIVGDRQYGRARQHVLPCPVNRQMLHAERLMIRHPGTDEEMCFTAVIAEDMQALLASLTG